MTPAHRARRFVAGHSPRIRATGFGAGALLANSGAILLLWQPVIVAVAQGHSVNSVVKNWYLSDQFSYLSITSNVKAGISAYREPIMLSGRSIYPSGYYWLLGVVGRLTSLDPLALWNIVGFLVTLALLTVTAFWAIRLSGRRWAALLGPLPLVVGTLQWWFSRTWRMNVGNGQAVQWPPAAILFNPGAEQATLALSLVVLMVVLVAMRPGGRIDWRWAATAGAIEGLALNAHSYVPLLCLSIVVASFVMLQLIEDRSPNRWAISVLLFCSSVGIAALHVPSAPLGRFVVVLSGLAVPLLAFPEWRQRAGWPLLAFAMTAFTFFLPLLIRIGHEAIADDSYLRFRQHLYDGQDLSIPMTVILTRALPVISLAIAAIVFLHRRRVEAPYVAPWISVIAAALGMSLLLEWNAHWGFGQEPYRFFPYQLVLVTAVASPWLASCLAGRWDLVTRAVVVLLLLATIPTTWAFHRDTRRQILMIPSDQQRLFREIGSHVPPGAVMIDRCVPTMTFKVLTDRPVAYVLNGLARPRNADRVESVYGDYQRGVLSGSAVLNRAGIGSFLSMNYCSGPSPVDLQRRFGSPIVSVRLAHPEVCGFPPDATWSLYRVPSTGDDKLVFRAWGKDPFRPPAGQGLPASGRQVCVFDSP